VGKNIQAKAADKRAEETYKDAEAVLKEAEEIQKHLLAQDEAISAIVEPLPALTPRPADEANYRRAASILTGDTVAAAVRVALR
jgi:hypothetical protein